MDSLPLLSLMLMPSVLADTVGALFQLVNSTASLQTCGSLSTVPAADIIGDIAQLSLPECTTSCLLASICWAIHFDKDQRRCTMMKKCYTTPANEATVVFQRYYGFLGDDYDESTCSTKLVASLPDSAMSASSSYLNLNPECAKLSNVSNYCGNNCYYGSWSSAGLSSDDYLQIDFLQLKTIMRYEIASRVDQTGCSSHQYVESFFLEYSSDGITYYSYRNSSGNTLFTGNSGINQIAGGAFPNPIVGARFVRIHPYQYSNWKSLRIELYGCAV